MNVYERANRFREFSIIERGRVCVPFDDRVMYYFVYFVSGDPRSNIRRGEIEHFSCELVEKIYIQ